MKSMARSQVRKISLSVMLRITAMDVCCGPPCFAR
jgi:hypothetical protein